MARLLRHERLDRLSACGRRFLGTDLAFMGGAMTWVSDAQLVAAIGDAGGFGVLACGSMGPADLEAAIVATRAASDRPFGVNLIVMHPDLPMLTAVCCDLGVGHVVLAGGMPPRSAVERLNAARVKVLAFGPSVGIARKLVRGGVDALIIEGMEAGGHIGPLSTSVLAQEILPEVRDVPVFVAGGIGHGEMIAAYLQMGAAGVQMGTVLACAAESSAHPAFKQALVRAAGRDAVVSVQVDPEFKVIPVRALANGGTRRFIDTQIEIIGRYRRGEIDHGTAALAIEQFWAGALRRAVIDGDVEQGSVMAGQAVGCVRSIRPMAAILGELAEQAEAALQRVEPPAGLVAAAAAA